MYNRIDPMHRYVRSISDLIEDDTIPYSTRVDQIKGLLGKIKEEDDKNAREHKPRSYYDFFPVKINLNQTGFVATKGVNSPCYTMGNTAVLVRAAQKGYAEIAELLLKAGADPSVCGSHMDNAGASTALMAAIEYYDKSIARENNPRYKIIQLLLDHGVDLSAKVFNYNSSDNFVAALYVAEKFNNEDVIQLLGRYENNKDKKATLKPKYYWLDDVAPKSKKAPKEERVSEQETKYAPGR